MTERYGAIRSVSFGQSQLSLPLGLRLWRRCQPLPAGGDADAFTTSIQIAQPTIGAEVRVRDTAAAEGLALGQMGVLSVELSATRDGQNGRTVSLRNAVLTGIELQYEQAGCAVAALTFLAEALDGDTDPFTAEEVQP